MNQQEPSILVIFGITGDLAKRKLLPALYHLIKDNLLHPETKIIGVTRQNIKKEDVLQNLARYTVSSPSASQTALEQFSGSFELLKLDLADQNDYKKLKTRLSKIDKKYGNNHKKMYYLSVPPSVMDEIISFMGRAKLNTDKHDRPILLVEKPFGYDLTSAKNLVKITKKYFQEEQIYRIDHYLAKETAQNLLDFRFKNPVINGLWNKNHVSKITVRAKEKIGIENRADFYEQTGALRDLIQSHLLLLLSLVLMEKPSSADSLDIHASRIKAVQQIAIPEPNEIATVARRGQYEGYRKDAGKDDSSIETYAKVRLRSKSPEWQGVELVLETGKAMDEKSTVIELEFKDEDHDNTMQFRLQPDEGIFFNLNVKVPGHNKEVSRTTLDFLYSKKYPRTHHPESYERVLLDGLNNDRTLFASTEEVLACWRIIQPILDEWQKDDKNLEIYPKGSARLNERG